MTEKRYGLTEDGKRLGALIRNRYLKTETQPQVTPSPRIGTRDYGQSIAAAAALLSMAAKELDRAAAANPLEFSKIEPALVTLGSDKLETLSAVLIGFISVEKPDKTS
jgi:hypothetical protein